MSASALSPGCIQGRRLLGPSVVIVLIVLGSGSALPSCAAGGSVGEMFESISGQDMTKTIQDLEGFGSRAFCLEKAWDAAAYVHGRFAALGLSVSYQNFSFEGYNSSNVVAVVPGTEPDAGTILFGAHYDSENMYAVNLALVNTLTAPGADDDASGVAAVIELAEALADTSPKHTVKFVAFGAEEMGYDDTGGLEGSSHFVAVEESAGERYELAVVLDMIGYPGSLGNQGVLVTKNADEPFGTRITQAVRDWNLDIAMQIEVSSTIRYSDHYPFWVAGYPAVLVTEELLPSGHPVNPYIHSSQDTASRLSESQMENLTRALLLATVAILGSSEMKWYEQMVVVIGVVVSAAVVSTVVILAMYLRKKKGVR